MSRVRAQVVSAGSIGGSSSFKMLELRRDDTGATEFQTTVADIQEGQWVHFDPSTARVFSEEGEDLTYLPQPVTVHGRVTSI
jgi:hypothetical protein